jgi:aryl-phospho-beta-D-glucosidase BglC (GH1 family)
MAADLIKLRADVLALIDKAISDSALPVTPAVPTPTFPSAMGYTVRAGKIYDGAGQRVQIRGVSHHGFNGDILRPTLLWVQGQDWIAQLRKMKQLGFNAIRVPFVPNTLYDKRTLGSWSYMVPGTGNDLIRQMTPLQALDAWMAEAGKDFYILLDFHSISSTAQYGQWFTDDARGVGMVWNKTAYTKDDWIRDLVFVAKRYKSIAKLIGIDLYNEPNGKVRWSAGDGNMTDPAYYWKPAVEEAAKAVLAANPNLLVFVQGVDCTFDARGTSGIPTNWGEDIQAQAYDPLQIRADKLVFTPHTYGPSVFDKESFKASDFPRNLPAQWDTLFGQFAKTNAVVPGEWGGKYEGSDKVWQDAFVDYLISRDMRDSFYWTWANSGDTGAVIDNLGQVNAGKMALLRRLWA